MKVIDPFLAPAPSLEDPSHHSGNGFMHIAISGGRLPGGVELDLLGVVTGV